MANKSKRIGTEGENQVRNYLQTVYGEKIQRLGGNVAKHDITGAPFPVEAKRRHKWEPQAWSRAMTEKHGSFWALFMIARDKRLSSSPPDTVLVPVPFFLELLAGYGEGELYERIRSEPRP